MDYLPILEQFKKDHIRAGEVLPFSSVPFLFHELKKGGLTFEDIDNQFYKTAIQVLFAEEDKGLQVYAVNMLFHYSKMLELTKRKTETAVVEKEQKTVPKQDAKVLDDGMISTEHLVHDIPSEEEEGDGLYMPPEEMISINPDELPSYEIDWSFAESVGMKRPEK